MQLEFFEVPSPCVGICQSNDKGFCIGCMRSRQERQEWKTLASDEKQKVIKRCIQRKKRQENAKKTTVNSVEATAVDEGSRQGSLLDTPSNKDTIGNTDLDFSDFEL